MNTTSPDAPTPGVWPAPRGPAAVARALEAARLGDPLGHRVHTVLAMLYIFLLPVFTTPKDIAFAALLIYTVVRLPKIWRCYPALFRDGLLWALLGWTLWQGVSIFWSEDVREGFESLRSFRVVLTPWLLWPVLDRVVWLIGAFLAGVFAMNLHQGAQGLEWFGLVPGRNNRLTAGIHAIQAGALCAAAMCWHLSLLLSANQPRTRLKLRWQSLSLIGLVAAGLGLVFTGSRGPWIAAAITIVFMLVVCVVRFAGVRKRAGILLLVGIVGAGAAWPLANDLVVSRINAAAQEVRDARENGVYSTSVGLRLRLWPWAWKFFQDSPIVGIGAGSFRAAQHADPDYQALVIAQPAREDFLSRGHAHSTYLQVLACTGLIGGIALTAVLVLLLCRTWRDPSDHPYALGTFFVLVTWMIGAQNDAYHLNGHLFGLFALIVAVTLIRRPPVRSELRSTDETADGARSAGATGPPA